MKLMKKLTALLLTLVMVLGMGSVVHASETNPPKGTITIKNAIDKQTYSIYRILELESYVAEKNYAYKATDAWKEFFKTGAGKDYLTIDDSGVVTSNTKLKEESDAAAFAKAALAYAKANTSTITKDDTTTATSNTVIFDKLPLGYYLVDSSTGALCSLNTTADTATIEEKNDVPSVEKTVDLATANIGQTVTFTTTIKAQPGAENYVLHDKMSEGLTFDANDANTVTVKKGTADVEKKYYTLKTTGLTDGCTFEIAFEQDFCNTLTDKDTIITVTYTAKLNEKAVIAGEGTNTTKLSYGDKSETAEAKTTTKTYEIPVYKYTMGTTNTKVALAGVKFTLRENAAGTDLIELVDTKTVAADGAAVYRHATAGDATTVTEVVTPDSGRFTIQGLKAGTYYLTETDTVTGYNKLTAPVTVVIDENGKVTVGDAGSQPVEIVEIENKTGSLLPSTGGRGTMAFYIVGALLVLGSGVVLITKKRMR